MHAYDHWKAFWLALTGTYVLISKTQSENTCDQESGTGISSVRQGGGAAYITDKILVTKNATRATKDWVVIVAAVAIGWGSADVHRRVTGDAVFDSRHSSWDSSIRFVYTVHVDCAWVERRREHSPFLYPSCNSATLIFSYLPEQHTGYIAPVTYAFHIMSPDKRADIPAEIFLLQTDVLLLHLRCN